MPEENESMDSSVHLTHQWLRKSLGNYIRSKQAVREIPPEILAIRCSRWVEAHGLEGLFYRATSDDAVLKKSLCRWRNKAMAELCANLQALQATIKLFAFLDAAEIPAAAMRGVVLAHSEYGSPAERTMRDVDVLAPSQSKEIIVRLLTAKGYPPVEKLRSQDVFKIDGTVVEMHWSLLTAKRYCARVDTKQLLQSRRRVETQDGNLYALSPEFELIGLVLHAFVHHELTIVKQLVDIGLYMKKTDLNWDFIANWCQEARLVKMFALTFCLVDELFFLKDDQWWQALSPASGNSLSAHSLKKRAQAWIYPFFGKRTVASSLMEKRNLLYAAEEPSIKFRQYLKFASFSTLRDLYRHASR